MTNQEAKEKIFYQWQDFLEHNLDYAGISDAYKMAIKALETIPKYKDTYNKGWEDGAKATYEHLKMCEEEQEIKTDSWSIKEIANAFKKHGLIREQEQSGDLISRDAVIEQTYLWSKDEFLRITNPFDYLRKRIKNLPSVNPQEPKTGHWIDTGSGQECSECHEIQYGYDSNRKYCANCGFRMIEPQESEDKG